MVFRVGTPGRLAGRCLRPSLSSRKSKATGVVAVPFSSAFRLCHLRFLPSFFFFFINSFIFLPRSIFLLYVYPSYRFYFLHFLFLLFSRRVVSFHRARIVYKSLLVSVMIHVTAGLMRLSSYIPRNSARVKTRKNK